MRKALKIIGITLASLVGFIIISAIVIFTFFPGLPVYIHVKNECPHIDQITEDYPYYDTEIPDNFVCITEKGITLMAPPEMFKKEDSYSLDVYIDKKEKPENTIIFTDVTVNKELDLFKDEDELTSADIEEFFEYLNTPVPTSNYEFLDCIMRISWDNFDIHDRLNSRIFGSLAEMKEIYFCSFDEAYFFESSNAKGSILVTGKDDKVSYFISLYSGENYQNENTICIKTKDPETSWQIISSIKLAEE